MKRSTTRSLLIFSAGILWACAAFAQSVEDAKASKNVAANSSLATPSITPKPFELNKWRIPDSFGIIKEVHEGNPEKTLVYLQDAHCNFEAQSNSAKILQDLVANYGLKLVNVEGSSGVIDTTPFAQFPDKDIKTEVATYFMKKGRITGPEFLSITSDLKFTIYGIEDEKMYKTNYDAFIKSLEVKEPIQKALAELQGYADIIKANIFSPELKDMDKMLADYKANKVSFTDFSDFLAKTAVQAGVDLQQYPNFVKQQEAKKLEAKVDFKAVDTERTQIIGKLEKAASKKQISEMVVKSLSFRMGKITAEEFYTFLKKTAQAARVDLSRYRNFSAYVDHLKLYAQINSTALFGECDQLAHAIQDKLCSTAEQKELARTVKNLGFLQDLFDLKLSSDDLMYYKTHRGEFSSEHFLNFFKKYANRYGISNLQPEKFSVLDRNFNVVDDFYDAAKKRDEILVENATQKMEADAERLAVLVTGGFHTEGITNILKRKGYSYVVVTPRITDLNAENYYLDVMTNKKTPFEELLGAGEEDSASE